MTLRHCLLPWIVCASLELVPNYSMPGDQETPEPHHPDKTTGNSSRKYLTCQNRPVSSDGPVWWDRMLKEFDSRFAEQIVRSRDAGEKKKEKQTQHLLSDEKGNKTSLSSCSPLSVTSATGKIMAQILKCKISTNSKSNRSWSNRRFGPTGMRFARKPKYFSEKELRGMCE